MTDNPINPYESPELPSEEIIISPKLRDGIEKLQSKLSEDAINARKRVDEYRESRGVARYVNETDYLNVAGTFERTVKLLGDILNKRDLCSDIQTLQNEVSYGELKAYNDVLNFMREHAPELEDIKVLDAKQKNIQYKSGCLPFAGIIHRMLGGGKGGRE
jgi:hypothetical protein